MLCKRSTSSCVMKMWFPSCFLAVSSCNSPHRTWRVCRTRSNLISLLLVERVTAVEARPSSGDRAFPSPEASAAVNFSRCNFTASFSRMLSDLRSRMASAPSPWATDASSLRMQVRLASTRHSLLAIVFTLTNEESLQLSSLRREQRSCSRRGDTTVLGMSTYSFPPDAAASSSLLPISALCSPSFGSPESGLTVLSSIVRSCSRFVALLEYSRLSSRSSNRSSGVRGPAAPALRAPASAAAPSPPPSMSRQVRGAFFVRTWRVSMILLATTGGRYSSCADPRELAGRLAAMAADAPPPPLRRNMPPPALDPEVSASPTSGAVPMRLRGGKSSASTASAAAASSFPFDRILTPRRALFASSFRSDTKVEINDLRKSGWEHRFWMSFWRSLCGRTGESRYINLTNAAMDDSVTKAAPPAGAPSPSTSAGT
mmetsp:Transcript_46639/g.141314  ORF Transcript_46639/g.141314 Transcript_46639/m.141314 type:complete len:429 (-) Transcript_46639:123-1409(-)